MTDKQIIIDGVDVSGCDCYCDGKCLCEYNEINRKIIRYYSCNKFPNCYYKQLKAKEQECEELKKKCNIYTCGICGNKEDCNKLYKTLTEIKEIAEKYNNPHLTHFGEQQYCCKDILQKISEVEDDNR